MTQKPASENSTQLEKFMNLHESSWNMLKKCPNNSWNFMKIHGTSFIFMKMTDVKIIHEKCLILTSGIFMKVHEDSPLWLKVTECAWTSRLRRAPLANLGLWDYRGKIGIRATTLICILLASPCESVHPRISFHKTCFFITQLKLWSQDQLNFCGPQVYWPASYQFVW